MPRPSLKQRADGRYKCVYNGVQFYGASQSEAYAKRDEYKKQIDRGLRAEAAGKTVGEYCNEWIVTYKSNVGTKSYNSYVGYLAILCKEHGSKKLTDITTSDIQRVFNTRAGNSGSDIKKFSMTINSMFESALSDGLIMRNPCVKAKRPEGEDGSHRALEPWERDIVERMAQTDHRFAIAAMIMLYAGLRRGEVLALNIGRDIDFDNKLITVREAVRFENNRPIIGDPKTEAGKRMIPLPDNLYNLLKGRQGLVISTVKGVDPERDKHLTAIAFRRVWQSYLSDASIMLNKGRRKRWIGKTKADKEILEKGEKLPEWRDFFIRTHDFRHSYCTMLYEAGIDIKTAQKWMGHADQAMTSQIYTHLTAQKEQESSEKLHAYLMEKVQEEVQMGEVII